LHVWPEAASLVVMAIEAKTYQWKERGKEKIQIFEVAKVNLELLLAEIPKLLLLFVASYSGHLKLAQ
jgi:hypothetical protein